MSLVHNERLKLGANALDRASTACVAIGVLGQAFALVPGNEIRLISMVVWLLAAGALHLAARRLLGGLLE